MATEIVPYGHPQHQTTHQYHPTPQEIEYIALKRAYLGLLPPPQIIEICLTFEVYVPPHVRASVWPMDLKAAITSVQARSQPVLDGSTDTRSPPTMAALKDPTSSTTDKSPEPSGDITVSAESLVSIQPGPQPAISGPADLGPPPPLPHIPYGYAPQASYPHAPYYSAPSLSRYSHPGHSPYPPYPPPHPTDPSNIASTSAQPHSHIHHTTEAQLAAEDLPSYEEIISEALIACTDAQGLAPKNIFTWMSSRYPLQSNFRPSASQALQKAFKRGRFIKSADGKYGINPEWAGGNTNRRHTRRPQTEKRSQATANAPLHDTSDRTGSRKTLFTRTPLENKRASTTPVPVPAPGGTKQAFPYVFPPAPLSTHSPETGALVTLNPNGNANGNTDGGDGGAEGGDAWEAAQNILKAINFGAFIQFNQDEGKEPAAIWTEARTEGLSAEDRALLQAQLALLAAQMAELGEVDSGEPEEALAKDLSVNMAGSHLTAATFAVDVDELGVEEEDVEGNKEGEEDDVDMEEVPVVAMHT